MTIRTSSPNLRYSHSSPNPLNRNSGTFFLTESSIFAIVSTILLVFLDLPYQQSRWLVPME